MAPTEPAADPERRLLRDEVYDRLFEAILSGELAPGQNLRDDELVAELGVSKAPIREALQKLREIGLIEMAPNRYTRVAAIEVDVVGQTLNTLMVLYEVAVGIGAPVLEQTDRDDLEILLATVRDSWAGEDVSALTPATHRYFRRYAEASGNAVLEQTIDRLTPHLLRSMAPRTGLLEPDEVVAVVERVHGSALAGDADAAAVAVRELGLPVRRFFLERVRDVAA